MLYNPIFNPRTDLCAVRPSLSVDLNSAVDSGVVPDTGVVTDYNEINDPNCILGRVSDPFQAIEAQKAILARGKQAVAPAAPAAPAATPTPEGA